MVVVAMIRLVIKNFVGFVPDTSIASICSVTFIELNSAPIWEPTLPEAINAVTKGANARTIALDIKFGSQEVAPKSSREGRDCLVNTKPTINPVKLINGNDFHPIS